MVDIFEFIWFEMVHVFELFVSSSSPLSFLNFIPRFSTIYNFRQPKQPVWEGQAPEFQKDAHEYELPSIILS